MTSINKNPPPSSTEAVTAAQASAAPAEPCSKCLSFLAPYKKISSSSSSSSSFVVNSSSSSSCCPICLGFWNDRDTMISRLELAIREAAEPYGGCSINRFCSSNNNNNNNRDNRLMVLPGDIVYRYNMATTTTLYNGAKPLQSFVSNLKQYANDMLDDCLDKFKREHQHHQQQQQQQHQQHEEENLYPKCVQREEQGYLALQVLLVPSSSVPRPPKNINIENNNNSRKKGRRRKQQQYVTQGGHPRSNLEQKLSFNNRIAQPPLLGGINQAMEVVIRRRQQQEQEQEQQEQELEEEEEQRRKRKRKQENNNNDRQEEDDDGDDDDWFFLDSKTQCIKSLFVPTSTATTTTNNDDDDDDDPLSSSSPPPLPLLGIHVALWRRPFYIQGRYTKTRRDVSQTPFFIDDDDDDNNTTTNDADTTTETPTDADNDDNDDHDINTTTTQQQQQQQQRRRNKKSKRRRLGITSIEELILPTLTKICGGISTINNSFDNGKSTNILYGMAKFHASGREDMDVRMILPSSSFSSSTANHSANNTTTTVPANNISNNAASDCAAATTNSNNDDEEKDKKKKKNEKIIITGRPFCCEMIDALRLPIAEDLKKVVHLINHNTTMKIKTDEEEGGDEDNDNNNNNNNCNKEEESIPLLPESNQYYGRSPLGVGVDPNHLTFAGGDVFKNLQSETEEKHKFYGCLCWSENKLPSLDELTRRLTTTTTPSSSLEGKEGGATSSNQSLFPLELKQQTPIRVLHRRANTIRIRHILSCHEIERLDDHYFRIHISTDAGTYVKEFCHGDLGRTQPNLSKLLGGGGRIDILELDCEGIQQQQHPH